MPIAGIAVRACCSTKSVNTARATLTDCFLWIAALNGVFLLVAGAAFRQAGTTTLEDNLSGTTWNIAKPDCARWWS
jgi:hypothetical protein